MKILKTYNLVLALCILFQVFLPGKMAKSESMPSSDTGIEATIHSLSRVNAVLHEAFPFSRAVHHEAAFLEKNEGSDDELTYDQKAQKGGATGCPVPSAFPSFILKQISGHPFRAGRLFFTFARRHILFRSLLI